MWRLARGEAVRPTPGTTGSRTVYTAGRRPPPPQAPAAGRRAGLVERLAKTLAPGTVGVVHRILSAVLEAAVRDRRTIESPRTGTRLPTVHEQRIEPLSIEAVRALTDAVPEHYRALVTLATGRVLRQGEALGLTVDRTVQARLGHASASGTLDTDSHLWPDSDDRTRAAVDAVLAPAAEEHPRNGDSRRTWERRSGGRRRTSRPVRRVLSSGASRPPDGRSSI